MDRKRFLDKFCLPDKFRVTTVKTHRKVIVENSMVLNPNSTEKKNGQIKVERNTKITNVQLAERYMFLQILFMEC